MKNLVLVLFLAFPGISAFANGDEYKTILNCKPSVIRPDLGMTLQLLESGITGSTVIRTTRYFLGHRQVNNYYVQRQPINPRIFGAPLVFKGETILFSINMTTSPSKNNVRPATLTTGQYGFESLLCKSKQ